MRPWESLHGLLVVGVLSQLLSFVVLLTLLRWLSSAWRWLKMPQGWKPVHVPVLDVVLCMPATPGLRPCILVFIVTVAVDAIIVFVM